MNFKTNDGIKFELEIIGDDVIAYNNDLTYLKDQELIFEGLWYELRNDAIADCRYSIGDGDYDWNEDSVKEIADSNLVYYVSDAYEAGEYKIKIN